MSQTLNKTLVVEDNALAREAVSDLLRRQGYDVTATADGQQALNYLRTNVPPDVIILDMLLPVLDGWRFLDEFKKMNVQPKPWVVVTTGSPALSREWAADHGCGGFLRKPVDEKELLAEMQRCLNRTAETKIT